MEQKRIFMRRFLLNGVTMFGIGVLLMFLPSYIQNGELVRTLHLQSGGTALVVVGGIEALWFGGKLIFTPHPNGKYHQGLHHVSLKTCGEEQFQQTVAFYRDVLGCPVVRAWGEGEGSGAMLDLGGALLEVTANGAPGLEKGFFGHIAFAAKNVDTLTERVRQTGRPVFLAPADKNLGGVWPIRVAFCKGPAGEDIAFFQDRS